MPLLFHVELERLEDTNGLHSVYLDNNENDVTQLKTMRDCVNDPWYQKLVNKAYNLTKIIYLQEIKSK
jgi:hypothetical protein